MHSTKVLVVLLAIAPAACARHSDACKKSADLVAPFAELALPVSELGGRVCEADGKKAKIEHVSTDDAGLRQKYEDAILAAGYKKKDCTKTQCVYVKGKARIRLNVLDLSKKWTTVFVEDYPER